MTVLIVAYEPETGEIRERRHLADHGYKPGENEIEVPHGDSRRLDSMRVDVNADPPELVSDPDADWQRPGVVDDDTRDLIAEKYHDKGGHALGELDAIQANENVPDEVTAYLQDVFAMQYLTYVSLTGDRVESVEDRFFSG